MWCSLFLLSSYSLTFLLSSQKYLSKTYSPYLIDMMFAISGFIQTIFMHKRYLSLSHSINVCHKWCYYDDIHNDISFSFPFLFSLSLSSHFHFSLSLSISSPYHIDIMSSLSGLIQIIFINDTPYFFPLLPLSVSLFPSMSPLF